MSAREERVGALAEALAAHHWGDDTAGVGEYAVQCGCGWKAYSSGIYDLRAKHDTHRANALADWLRDHDARVRAEALRDAADEVDAEWNRLDVEFRPIRGDLHNEGVLSGLERAENLLRARADREAGA